MRVKTHMVLMDCIESGIKLGWNRAHKHDDNPTPQVIKRCIDDAIHGQLGEYFEYDATGDWI